MSWLIAINKFKINFLKSFIYLLHRNITITVEFKRLLSYYNDFKRSYVNYYDQDIYFNMLS